MSVAREVTINYDLDTLAEAAKEAGFIVTKGTSAKGYYGEVLKGAASCDLVISSRTHRFDMGFVRQSDGTIKLISDTHGGNVQHDLSTKILPRYAERMLERDRRFKVTHREETNQMITLTVGRR